MQQKRHEWISAEGWRGIISEQNVLAKKAQPAISKAVVDLKCSQWSKQFKTFNKGPLCIISLQQDYTIGPAEGDLVR